MLRNCKILGSSRRKWSSKNEFLLYADNIYDWMRRSELSGQYQTDISYMQYQQDINSRMRTILVDWLIDLHQKFALQPETLYIAVNTIDRFLMKRMVMRSRLQLVGVTSLYISCKYQEIYPPALTDMVLMTANAYTGKELLEMESEIL